MKVNTFACIALLALVSSSFAATPKTPPVRNKDAGKCKTDKDCVKYPGTLCVQFTIGDYTAGKCTPNYIYMYGTRPMCRGGQSGLCPSYQPSTAGYMNTQCVLVDKSMQPATDGAIIVPSSKPTESPATPGSSNSTNTPNSTKAARLLADKTSSPPLEPAGNKTTAPSGNKTTAPPNSASGSTSGSGSGSGGLIPPAPRTPIKEPKCPTDPSLDLNDPGCWFGTSYQNKTITVQYRCIDYDMCLSQSAAAANSQALIEAYCRPKACVTGQQQLCNNRGTCQGNDPINAMDPKGYTCRCYAGFSGLKCEKTQNTKDCDVDCGLGGACINNECTCYAGFVGKDLRCSKCTSNDACENGNECDIPSGKCKCADGYVGDTCGGKLNNCAGVKCSDGGFSSDSDAKICQCNCPRQILGKNVPCDGSDCSKCADKGAGAINGVTASSMSLIAVATIVASLTF